jgi:hypothetical protein
MPRPAKYRTQDGRPIRRLGERRLTVTDETGKVHEVVNLDEACQIIHGSKYLVRQLTVAGVIRVVTDITENGPRMYSRHDLEAVAAQLFRDDHPSAADAVGLRAAEPVVAK